MTVQNTDGLFRSLTAKRVYDGTVIRVGATLPACPPGGEQKTGAGRMQSVDRFHQSRHVAGGCDQPMKPPVCFFPSADVLRIVTLMRRGLRLIQNGCGQVGDGITQSKHFERGTHLRHFPHISQAEIGHPNAAARNADGQALRLQAPKGFSHRHMRGTELFGDVILPQPFARRKLTAHDALGERAADLGGNRIVRLGFWNLDHDLT